MAALPGLDLPTRRHIYVKHRDPDGGAWSVRVSTVRCSFHADLGFLVQRGQVALPQRPGGPPHVRLFAGVMNLK